MNVGQTSFEAIAQVVKRVCSLVEEQNDQHSRNNLLSTYIQYTCTLPHPDPGPLCKKKLHFLFCNYWTSFLLKIIYELQQVIGKKSINVNWLIIAHIVMCASAVK